MAFCGPDRHFRTQAIRDAATLIPWLKNLAASA
jgi:hypothetical protein